MKHKRIFVCLPPLVALILELLPWGVVLRFMSDPSLPSQVVKTSYFDPLPFGYGNFAPMITAVLTCMLLAIMLVYLAKGSQKLMNAGKFIALTAAVVSVLPAFLSAYTLIGGVISLCLAGETVMLFMARKAETEY